jgi:hypothetical protein
MIRTFKTARSKTYSYSQRYLGEGLAMGHNRRRAVGGDGYMVDEGRIPQSWCLYHPDDIGEDFRH